MRSVVSLEVSLTSQTLTLFQDRRVLREFSVSTARNGAGELNGSECTPRGHHYIRACIGTGQPAAAVFRGRRPTGEVWTPELSRQYPQRDWILSRILWLCGRESGRNRRGAVDSMRRYIYIHGTPDTEPMGIPLSHGCIRMRNDEIIWLFDRIRPGTAVNIRDW